VEDINLSIHAEDMPKRLLFADPCDEVQQAKESLCSAENEISTTSFWDILSFIPETEDYSPPNAILRFFSFTLRKYFNYQFSDDAFAEDPDPGSFSDIPFHSLALPRLFSKGEWGGLLVEPID
jgi:hypothetical protein